MTKTELLIEYCERTKDFDFSEDLDDLIEKDYVIHRVQYTDEFFNLLRMNFLMDPDAEPAEILRTAKIQVESQ